MRVSLRLDFVREVEMLWAFVHMEHTIVISSERNKVNDPYRFPIFHCQ